MAAPPNETDQRLCSSAYGAI